jgi:hypothetical protein
MEWWNNGIMEGLDAPINRVLAVFPIFPLSHHSIFLWLVSISKWGGYHSGRRNGKILGKRTEGKEIPVHRYSREIV